MRPHDSKAARGATSANIIPTQLGTNITRSRSNKSGPFCEQTFASLPTRAGPLRSSEQENDPCPRMDPCPRKSILPEAGGSLICFDARMKARIDRNNRSKTPTMARMNDHRNSQTPLLYLLACSPQTLLITELSQPAG